ncbi:MAG: VWA domain-containing protein [Acidobacteriota bacterium]
MLLVGLFLPALLLAQQPDQSMPRFRAGANLVRVDAYVSKDSVAIEDLKAADFTVFEDDKPQTIENFQLVKARPPNPQTERTNPTNVRDMNQEVADAARVFTLFFDHLFVQIEGSYHAQKPIIETLDKLIGPDDLVGVMTPEISPSAVTYSRRTGSIEKAITDTWYWGGKNRLYEMSDEERALEYCYATHPDILAELIGRLREKHTLDALDGLVGHLELLRPERKFVMVFTEGWPLYRPNEALARVLDGRVPTGDPAATDPRTGGFRRNSDDPATGSKTQESCDRQRTMLAYSDHETEFRQLLQRANRANVSFYPIDARGLVVFDTPINWGIPPAVDQTWMNKRFDDLRSMASQTDGQAILNASDVSKSMQKAFADVGSYYLLSYYSTNQKLDGRFRRIRVEVKRDGADVRSRPGYLAPTEAEARAAGVAIARPGAKPEPPPAVTRALDAIAPARGNLPVRVQAVGGRNTIRAVVELDPVTAKLPEWISGGTLKLTIEPERLTGTSPSAPQTMTLAIDPGQRSIVINGTEQPLAPGRYQVRAEVMARNSRLPLQVTTFTMVPPDAAEVGTGALASRRGPSTGLVYVPTADPRFRRTERLRLEVPLAGEGFTGTGHLLTRDGQSTALIVNFSTRTDEATKQQFGVADLNLAPLAEAEYVLEVTLTKNGKTEVVSYGFRLIA